MFSIWTAKQGRLSTDGDKCATVNFFFFGGGGNEQKSLILNFMQKCEFCAQIQINNLQFALRNLVLVFLGLRRGVHTHQDFPPVCRGVHSVEA